MGHLKDIRNQANIQTFPEAAYEIVNPVPFDQCSAAVIDLNDADFDGPADTITLINAFKGFDLTGKFATITQPLLIATDFPILSNTDDVLTIDTPMPFQERIVAGRVKDPANEYITRNISSFVRFIEWRGSAYCIKGGILYTDLPNFHIVTACNNIFDPLT